MVIIEGTHEIYAQSSDQRALTKLHEEFPILNDIDTQVEFSVQEGATMPQNVIWRCAQGMKAHLNALGVVDKVQQIIRALIEHKSSSGHCEGVIKFHCGHVEVRFVG